MKYLLFVVVVTTSVLALGQNYNRPTPSVHNQYEFQKYDTTSSGNYYLVAPYLHPNASQNNTPNMLYILDENGYIVWWTSADKRYFDFKYHPEQGLFSFMKRKAGIRWHYEMNEQFEVIDSTSTVNNVIGDIHEFQIFPNGNRCIIGAKFYMMDLSSYTIAGAPGDSNTNVLGAVIQEFDPNGNLVFEWESVNHITPDYFVPNSTYNINSFDYLHLNSIEFDPSDSNLILSCRTANMICKIDHSTGDLIWALNGQYPDFTITNDSGFLGQHDARLLPNGNLSLFDNDYAGNAPRSIEYELNFNTMEATKVNELSYSFNFSASSLGNFQQLDNGYGLIGWGHTFHPAPNVTLFDANGTIAADILFQDTVVSYRAFFQELPNFPAQPQILCEDNGAGIELSVTGNHASYIWSTGETTASITITQPGEYQCWVDRGYGYLGSTPISFTTVECPSAGLLETTANTPEIIGYFDLLGRKLDAPAHNELFVTLYDDGSSKLIFGE